MKSKSKVPFYCACLAIILIGLNAGFFYTWSFTITQSLGLIEPGSAMSAMQSINANIRNGWFAAIFFGAPVLLLLTTLLFMFKGYSKPAVLFALAFIGAAATVAVTMTIHVPMNNTLATASTSAADAAQIWTNYSMRWTMWNHLRAATSTLSFVLALVGVLLLAKRSSRSRH